MSDLKRKVLNFINGADPNAASAATGADPRARREVPAIGHVLRSARLEAGLELRDVATMLKIRHVFMLAIEDARYSDLPGAAYAVGFVRAYADYLGLDGDAVVRRFKEEVAGNVGHQNLYFPTPVPEGRVPGGTILLFSVILVCLVYGGWYVLSATDRSMVDVVPALPQRLVSLLEVFSHGGSGGTTTAPAPAPSGAPNPASTDAGALPASALSQALAPEVAPALPGGLVPRSTGSGERPGTAGAPVPLTASAPTPTSPLATATLSQPTTADSAGDSGDEIPLVSGPADEEVGEPGPKVPMAPRAKPAPPGSAGETPPVEPAPIPATPVPAPAPLQAVAEPANPALPLVPEPAVPTGRVYGGQNHDSRVQIRALQDAWVQIRDGNGDPVFTRVMHTGDIYRVADRPGMRLRTGNAGGLASVVDGGEPQVLGAVGQVLRDVPIDTAHLPRGAANGGQD